MHADRILVFLVFPFLKHCIDHVLDILLFESFISKYQLHLFLASLSEHEWTDERTCSHSSRSLVDLEQLRMRDDGYVGLPRPRLLGQLFSENVV